MENRLLDVFPSFECKKSLEGWCLPPFLHASVSSVYLKMQLEKRILLFVHYFYFLLPTVSGVNFRRPLKFSTTSLSSRIPLRRIPGKVKGEGVEESSKSILGYWKILEAIFGLVFLLLRTIKFLLGSIRTKIAQTRPISLRWRHVTQVLKSE